MLNRFWIIKIGGGLALGFMAADTFVKPVVRKLTGWEDYEAHPVNKRNIEIFIEKQEGKKVKEMKEGENYF